MSSIYPSGNFQEVVENETEHTFTTSVRPLFITISKHHYNNANDNIDYIPYQAITGGTYSNDIIVNYWNELHIPQGSYLKFTNGVKIDVKGKLFVEGTSSNNVTFTSSNATPNKNDWYGINLDGVNANIIMNYSNLEFSTYGIKFNNGAKGIVENSSTSNNYYGIYISSSEPTINNNSVYNNNYGIYISNSYVPQWTVININDNNITNNSSYGLFAYNSSPNLYNNSINNNRSGVALLFNSNPIFDHNSISSNTSYGLLCYGSSSPSLHYSSSYNYGGYNTILANGDEGIIITVSSAPNFGAPTTSLGGYNSIYNNTNYDAYNYTNNYIFACNNWWGSKSGPNTNKLYGTIRFFPFLYDDPQPQYSLSTQNNLISSKVLNSISSPKIPSKLLDALFDQMQGHFEKSANSFSRFLSSNRSSSFIKFAAVNFIKSIFSYLSPQDSYNIIEKLLKRGSFSEIKYELLSAQVSSLIHKENYTLALVKTQSAYDGLKLNSEQFFANKFNEAIINVYGLNNIERGTQLLKEIVNESDKTSIDNLLAQEELQNISLISVLPKSNNGSTKTLNSLNSLTNYQLSQNYPNPFNPTTTINYTIPQDGTVTLKIYNVLGAEVMTLVNKTQTKGKYQVTFDASRLSSGIYFYRIQSGSFFNSKKMILLK